MTKETCPSSEGDFIEIGDSGWIAGKDGSLINAITGETIDSDGKLYDKFGEMVIDPYGDEDYED